MAVNLQAPDAADILAVPGIELAVASVGVKPGSTPGRRDDLALLQMAAGGTLATVFTRSAFPAACVTVARNHLRAGKPRALLINSGNANCATGARGEQAALDCCAAVATALGLSEQDVLPFSTGVIGEQLPVARMLAAVPDLARSLAAGQWLPAAKAIMTTDTVAKLVSRRLPAPFDDVLVTGMAKGSGMIQPDMATMLAYMATNARVPQDVLQPLLRRVTDASFNRITVDTDTSTNDALVLLASGQTSVPEMTAGSPALAALEEALLAVATSLAVAVVRDGEGATRLITVEVSGASSDADALLVARSVANSPLVKTAMFAADPNWGRFVMAIGKAGVPIEPSHVGLALMAGDDLVRVAAGGELVADYAEAAAARVMAASEVRVQITLGAGAGTARVWTCDLSYDYVKINAEYRT